MACAMCTSHPKHCHTEAEGTGHRTRQKSCDSSLRVDQKSTLEVEETDVRFSVLLIVKSISPSEVRHKPEVIQSSAGIRSHSPMDLNSFQGKCNFYKGKLGLPCLRLIYALAELQITR